MDWVKLSARYYLDAAVVNFDDATEVMFTRSIAYSGDQETHGFIPSGILPALCRRRRYEACAEALVASGLWLPARGGYQITRWEEWQSELEAIVARRSADRDRKRRERAARAAHNSMSRDIERDAQDDNSQVRGMSRDMSAGQSAPIERREIDKHPPHPSGAPPPRAERGTRIPDPFPVTADMASWAAREFPHVDIRYETAKFSDYWRAKTGRGATKRDWPATWRNWIRRASEHYGAARGRHHRQQETDELFNDAMLRAQAREETNDPQRNGHPDPLRQSALPSPGD